MSKAVLGIDLGTSSVKVMLRYKTGEIVKTKQTYDEISPKGWVNAIEKAVSKLGTNDICAIGLSSQVGTYILDEGKVISWNENIGKDELDYIKNKYSKEEFINEISMPHPDIISYPLPRLYYIKKHFRDIKNVCQPKDYLCNILTKNYVADKYSYRGLANLENGKYSQRFIEELGLGEFKLPEISDFSNLAGVTVNCSFLPDNIPVYVGLNDYYSSLLGMGITDVGDMFDITGTSEHLGIIEDKVRLDTNMVSGPYLYNNVHYGVTASAGASLDFGMSLSEEIDIQKSLPKNPPIFLPYLNGERAPIWDSNAKGVFWGITANTNKNNLAYSIFEGVVFSLYHIYECMGKPVGNGIKVSGGAAKSDVLNTLKAELFDTPVITLEENDTSVLGACIIAASGEKWYKDIEETAKAFCRIKKITNPNGNLRDILKKRFETYKTIYPAVKDIK